jgi:hypothetical protein
VDDAPNDGGAFDPNDFAPSEEDQFYNQRAVWRQGLTLVHISAQPVPFLTQNAP